VPEGLREQLAAAQILSYRVMRFEREGRVFATRALSPLGRGLRRDPRSAAPGRMVEGNDLTEAAGLVFLPMRRRPPPHAPPRRPP